MLPLNLVEIKEVDTDEVMRYCSAHVNTLCWVPGYTFRKLNLPSLEFSSFTPKNLLHFTLPQKTQKYHYWCYDLENRQYEVQKIIASYPKYLDIIQKVASLRHYYSETEQSVGAYCHDFIEEFSIHGVEFQKGDAFEVNKEFYASLTNINSSKQAYFHFGIRDDFVCNAKKFDVSRTIKSGVASFYSEIVSLHASDFDHWSKIEGVHISDIILNQNEELKNDNIDMDGDAAMLDNNCEVTDAAIHNILIPKMALFFYYQIKRLKKNQSLLLTSYKKETKRKLLRHLKKKNAGDSAKIFINIPIDLKEIFDIGDVNVLKGVAAKKKIEEWCAFKFEHNTNFKKYIFMDHQLTLNIKQNKIKIEVTVVHYDKILNKWLPQMLFGK